MEKDSITTKSKTREKIIKPMDDTRIIIIVQARMGATRLPGKPMMVVKGKPLLQYLVERLDLVINKTDVVVATTQDVPDDIIADFCSIRNISSFRGPENDVLRRYTLAATQYNADIIVRITGDCPLIDYEVVDKAIKHFVENYPKYDYVSNTLERTYPRGLDVEVFTRRALEEANLNASETSEREHVTPYIYNHPEIYKIAQIKHSTNLSHHRWTVDTPEDYELIKLMIEETAHKHPKFTLKDLVKLHNLHPEWIEINSHVQQKKT